ncbi:MAG: hypothetical protein WBX78_08305, partial [Pseudolabrys sp.]
RSLRISVVIYPARPDLDRHGAKLSGAVWKLTRSPCLTRDPANWCPNNVQIRRHTDYPREFLDLRTFYAGPQSLFVAPTMMFIAAMRRCGTAHAFFNIQIMRRMSP